MFARIFTKSIILIIFEQWHYCMIKDPTHELSSVRYSSMGLPQVGILPHAILLPWPLLQVKALCAVTLSVGGGHSLIVRLLPLHLLLLLLSLLRKPLFLVQLLLLPLFYQTLPPSSMTSVT